MIYIGVDPGKHGAYAIIGVYPEPLTKPWDDAQFSRDMRDVATLIERTRLTNDAIKALACVEKVGARPGQGVSSMFSFGKSAGYIEGVLTALGIPFQFVPPQKWKKEFSLGHDKAQSIEVCKKLFPDVRLIPEGKRKEQDGLAEALLMAEYAKRHF